MPAGQPSDPSPPQAPSSDIRQYYQQGLASVLNSPQFVSVDEPSKRNLIGSFIYPYINLIMRQVPDQTLQRTGPDGLSPLTAKVTGMVIEIPNLTQMLMAC